MDPTPITIVPLTADEQLLIEVMGRRREAMAKLKHIWTSVFCVVFFGEIIGMAIITALNPNLGAGWSIWITVSVLLAMFAAALFVGLMFWLAFCRTTFLGLRDEFVKLAESPHAPTALAKLKSMAEIRATMAEYADIYQQLTERNSPTKKYLPEPTAPPAVTTTITPVAAS